MITKGKLNRMCKYFKGKQIDLRYEYNNSLGMYREYLYEGVYDKFHISEHDFSNCKNYDVKFYLKDKIVFEVGFDYYAEFTGIGKIRENNSGPYCYFSIVSKESAIKSFFKKIINKI